MLESVALRLLGCDEYSRPKSITFALDTLTLIVHPEKRRPKKDIEEDLRNLVPVRRALMSIPTLKHCHIRTHAKPQDVPAVHFPLNEEIERPHYQVGQRVWCRHGGWGFWPATVFAIEDTCLEILLCWGDMTQVTYADAPSDLHPFMHHLAKYCTMTTNQQEGFHEGVEKALDDVVRLLPSYFVEMFAVRPRERFAARMLRIAGVFENYIKDLLKVPIFRCLPKETLKRNTKIAKEIEGEEKKIVAEQRRKEMEEKKEVMKVVRALKEEESQLKRAQREEERAHRILEKEREGEERLQLKVHNAIQFPAGSSIFAVVDKMIMAALKKNVIPLKHMLRNLAEQSHIPPDRKRKRSVVNSYNDIKINGSFCRYPRRGCPDDDSFPSIEEVNREIEATAAEEASTASKCGRKSEKENKGQGLSLLETVQMAHVAQLIQQERKENKGVPIYTFVYESLMRGAYTDEESLVYCIENRLSSKLIKMLLFKYFPFDIYKDKNGRTLIHLAAQNDFSTVITMLNEHWEKRFEVIHDHVINNVSNFAMTKDGFGRTAVHIACEYGSLKSLKILKQLGCDLYERDKHGYTPLMWCASKDSPDCAFYLIENGADVTQEDRRGRSTLWHAMAGESTLLGKTLFRNGCWMQGNGLQEFVADMSLGREPHKIMFDSRTLEECKAYYLSVEEQEEEQEVKGRGRELRVAETGISGRTRRGRGANASHLDEEEQKQNGGCGSRKDGVRDGARGSRNRVSSRVVQMSKEVADDTLAVESSKWSLSDHMARVCVSSPDLIPKFVYSTQSFLGKEQTEVDSAPALHKSYDCCNCKGDCMLNPECKCIMRNGQRSPYSREGLIDFTKSKIFECGDNCSCKDSCKLRMTQQGVAFPLVVCRVGGKGHGVMTTKVIVKGSYVCAYVGERVSEDDLVEQEEEKIRAMKKMGNFVTYAFEIHEGCQRFNVDSEYVGNVARFFNHSCDPNLRPVKVVAASHQKWPTMCFFAVRRIEAGEELTWKYVTGESTKKGGQACFCQAPNCTGFV